jgi:uncharacterized oxidoreductase
VLNGMLTILFDPQRLGNASVFGGEMQAFVDWVKASPPQPGVDHVRVAGDPEREMRAKRLADGIPVDDNTWKELLAAAAKLDRDPAELNRLADVDAAI